MADRNVHKERLASIRHEWNRAEEDIKLAEQIGGKVVFPAIAELRYAGRRLIEALHQIDEGGSDETINALLQDAEFDCHRARHDAIDAATATISIELRVIAKKIGYDVAVQCYQQFPKLISDLDIIRDKIADSRKHRSEREKIYSAIEAIDFREIVSSYRTFMSTEDMMKGIAKKRRVERAIVYAIGISGLLVGIVGWVI